MCLSCGRFSYSDAIFISSQGNHNFFTGNIFLNIELSLTTILMLNHLQSRQVDQIQDVVIVVVVAAFVVVVVV